MGVAGTNIYPRCSHCGQQRSSTDVLRCPHCGRAGRRLLNGYCDECVEKRASSGAHLSGARKCVMQGCPNYTDEGRFIGDVCAPCWSFMITGRTNSSWACRNVFREVSRALGEKAGKSVEKFVADAIFVTVSAAEPTRGESPKECSEIPDSTRSRVAAEILASSLGVADAVLSTRVEDLELSERATYFLMKKGGGVLPVRTVGELVQVTERELCGVPGVSRRTVQEVKEVLAGMGLSLATVSAVPK